jgi:hypothetical protein
MNDAPHWRDLLGPEIGWLSVCGFLGDTERRCGKSAKWHLWLAEDEGMIGSCDEHVLWARANLALKDEHAWGRWCNLPGAVWVQLPPMSWCEMEHGDPLAELDRAPQPHEQELVNCC